MIIIALLFDYIRRFALRFIVDWASISCDRSMLIVSRLTVDFETPFNHHYINIHLSFCSLGTHISIYTSQLFLFSIVPALVPFICVLFVIILILMNGQFVWSRTEDNNIDIAKGNLINAAEREREWVHWW